ncbi:uncharacterized protein LOC114521934 [Dendronephthya gigantea]|uniref:uncharacterized protein LOC114521934 n=1 Tax=Dendronephthya gigantea TaxID=151771 RepID=UPI00106B6F05|nr:uncharacterized protein LOC114521934 [Dendronephthya gigantea]
MATVEGNEFMLDRRRYSISETNEQSSDSYHLIPYGFQPKACYKPKAKRKEITGVTYNSRSRQFIILDSKGITAWSHNSVINAVSRLLDYPSYQFNLIQLLLHSKKFNVYFGLSKDYALKVFNLNFHEVFSVISDMNSVLCMVFNSVTDELITGGTGGIKFWTFGEIQSEDRSMARDSRPMANYGLILRREHPAVNGTMVKDIILDEKNQRLYCLSERNVVAYELKGNFLFELKSAHDGQVTGCVYSKFSNFVVTAGTDCAVNVWSSNGGCLHSFRSHSKMVTNLLLHPEAPSLVITSSQDGTVKVFSLDIMEEIYSQVVFPEGIEWMNFISQDILYCSTGKALQVFSINHVTNFWTTVRCPVSSLSLTNASQGNGEKVLVIADDYSARILSKGGRLLSTVLPPPPVPASQQSQHCSGHAFCPIYNLMYLLVNQEEIWVYYTKSNPANRVEVWKLSDVQDISNSRVNSSRNDNNKSWTPVSSRAPSSPFVPPGKVVDGVACLSLGFLHSTVNLKNKSGETYPDLTYYLVAGLQDGRLLFTSPFSAVILYFQFQATKGAVLSIHHDVTTNVLLLKTVALDKYTIQIRSLPDLNMKHSIEAGNDLTCYVRMADILLSGHKTGRLNLYRLDSEQGTLDVETKTVDCQKVSKDHLDSVFTVDANDNLQLFCSSSKDGCIKIWNNNKVLLREIIMDKTLTSVCFLNLSGDLLAGFKNHVFFISREKAHLTSYNSTNSRRTSEIYETGSDIYEDPRVRFEYKKVIPPDPIHMETYLVPFANMNLNLARFLSGQVQPNALEDDIESEIKGTESELSDSFSVAPTEIYMSQSGTPRSRSRSSSIVSSWNLPNIGSSPVSSPPRTPPPFMSPVFELEVEDEAIESDGEGSESERVKYFIRSNESEKTQTEKKSFKAIPVFTRKKRPGLSERKIDSRALQSRQNVTNNSDNVRTKRENATTGEITDQKTANSTTSPRPTRTVVKKVKKKTEKSQRKLMNSQQTFSEDNMTEKVDQEENSLEANNNSEECEVGMGEEKMVKQDMNSAMNVHEKVDIDRTKDETQSLHTQKGESISDQKNILSKSPANDLMINDGKLHENVLEETLGGEMIEDKFEQDESFDIPSPKKTRSDVHVNDIDYVHDHDDIDNNNIDDDEDNENDNKSDEERMVFQATGLSSPRVPSRESSLSNTMSNLEHQETCDQLGLPSNDTDFNENMERLNLPKEDSWFLREHPTKNTDLSDDEDNTEETRNENLDEVTSRNVSFILSKANGKEETSQEIISSRSLRRRKISGRRSVSPVSSTKVVPILNSSSNEDTRGERLHPNSALKIYALAKTRRRTISGRSLVSKPNMKQHILMKHNTSQASIMDNGGISRTFVDILGYNKTPKTVVDTHVNEVITETVKNKDTKKEKKDLVNWCMRALSEKAKYPIFSPKPRLRSRRSLLKDEGKLSSAVPPTMMLQHPNTQQSGVEDDILRATERRKNKPKRQNIFKADDNVEEKRQSSFVERKLLHRGMSEHANGNVLDYSDGWQERILEKAKEVKAKHLERKRKVLEKRVFDEKTLEEKRCVLQMYGSTGTDRGKSDKPEGINKDINASLFQPNSCISKGLYMERLESPRISINRLRRIEGDTTYGSPRITIDKDSSSHESKELCLEIKERHKFRGTKKDQAELSERVHSDDPGYEEIQSDGKDLKHVRSSYEHFKSNPVIIQPYRLEKYNSQKDELLLHELNLDFESAKLPDHLLELIPRPKSAPSIPSKCRKYVLVSNDSEKTQDKPEPTALEETLLLQRFPKSNLDKLRGSSPLVHEVRRSHTLQRMQKINMSSL